MPVVKYVNITVQRYIVKSVVLIRAEATSITKISNWEPFSISKHLFARGSQKYFAVFTSKAIDFSTL